MILVPIRSYSKLTVIALFNNEGEVNFDHMKLSRRINDNPDLLFELTDIGYKPNRKDFNAQQIAVLFSYIGHPILNAANSKLLGVQNKAKQLVYFSRHPKLINSGMENINKLSNDVLYSIGLMQKGGGDLNEHFDFSENENYYFIRTGNGFRMIDRRSLKAIKTINTTEELIKTLLKLKNEADELG